MGSPSDTTPLESGASTGEADSAAWTQGITHTHRLTNPKSEGPNLH
jgi:hypothetical protein